MRSILLFLLAGLACSAPSLAQDYRIAAAVIAGGGGTSSGGSYALSGTIAQHEASPALAGGGYAVKGGFWSLYSALQSEGAPNLRFQNWTATTVRVAWAANAPGWVLQVNTSNLAAGGWVDVAGSPTVSGAEQYHEVSTTPGRKFFRLRKR